MNLEIRNFFLLLISVITVMLFVLFLTIYELKNSSYKLNDLVIDRHEMIIYSSIFKQSSEDLTKFARLYAITGENEYKQNYLNILDIRMGKKPRPQNYNLIYWDLSKPIRSQRHPLGETKALEEIFKELPFDEYERDKLKEAQKNSQEVIKLETEAFNAMYGIYKDEKTEYMMQGEKNQQKAIELLHSIQYLKVKEYSMLPVDEFLTHLEERTLIQIDKHKDAINFKTRVLVYIISLFIFISILFFYLLIIKILHPISYLTEEMHKFKNPKNAKDIETVDKIFYNDEIGYMTKQFYKMRDNINNDINLRSSHDRKIKEYLSLVDQNVITSSTDLKGKITSVSEAFCNISGYSKEELLGQNHSMVRHQDMSKELYEELWSTIKKDLTWHGEIKNKTKNGNFYWVNATIYPIVNDIGVKIGYTAIRLDITDKKKIEELVITDGLTGIYNRKYFNEILPKLLNMITKNKKVFSFLLIDIDFFKQYNESYGHQEGDRVLVDIGQTIEKSLPKIGDICFRFGGETFGVIFEASSELEAYTFAETIRENIENRKIKHNRNEINKYLTISIGLVTRVSNQNLDEDLVYKEADNYLYKAKSLGKNRVEALNSLKNQKILESCRDNIF